MRRSCWLVLVCVAGLVGGEVATDPSGKPIPPPLPRFSYTQSGGASYSFSPDRPSEALGVQVQYDDIRLQAGRLTYRMSDYPGASRPLLLDGQLDATPELPLELDTSNSHMEGLAFRGLLRPARITFKRQDPEEGKVVVRYRVEIKQVGGFHGMIDTPRGPRQLVADAETVVLDLTAPLEAGAGAFGLGRMHLMAMHLYGTPERLMRFLTIRVAVPEAAADIAQQWEGQNWGVRKSNDWLSLQFDDNGRLTGSQEGLRGDYQERDGEGAIMQREPTSVPSLGK